MGDRRVKDCIGPDPYQGTSKIPSLKEHNTYQGTSKIPSRKEHNTYQGTSIPSRKEHNTYQGTTSVVPTQTAGIKGFSLCLLCCEIPEQITELVTLRGEPLFRSVLGARDVHQEHGVALRLQQWRTLARLCGGHKRTSRSHNPIGTRIASRFRHPQGLKAQPPCTAVRHDLKSCPDTWAKACFTLVVLLALAGCRLDMQDQPKYKPLAASTFFIDGRSARPIPPGTIARDALNDTDVLHTGADGKGFAATIPMAVDQGLLERGQDRFDIYCAPCHGYLGDGDGMVARRGFKIPPSLHHERVRQAPPGYLFQVITNGYGAMGDYGDQVPPEDRWAIVAYIRALELARGATMADATPEGQAELEAQR
jgi:mono/diheme cytochrome c family protein